MLRHATSIFITMLFITTPAVARTVGTGAAATTVLAVFIAVIVALVGLGVAVLLWLRGRRWRLRIADERVTIDGLMGAAEDLLATAEDGYMIWPYGGERAAASDRLGGMFRLDPEHIADIDALAGLVDADDFAVFRRAVAGLRSNGVPFMHELRRLSDAVIIRTRGGLAGSGAAVVWFRDQTELQSLTTAYADQLRQAMADGQHLRALLDGAPFPVWRRNAELAVDWGNKAYCEAVEADLAAVIDQGIELVPGIAAAEARALARTALTDNAARAERRRFVVAGDRRTYELVETPLLAESGGAAGYARDVTDRDDAAGDLERHIEAQNDVLDQVHSAIAIFGPTKQLVFFNAAYARLWRLDEDWLATRPSHGDILERLREHRRLPEQADFPAFKTETLNLYTSVIERQEDQLHLPDGTTLRVVITPHPFGGLLFIYEDVSARLELERARNTLAAVQRATLDHLFEGVAVFGANGRLELYNPGYAKIWQLDAELLNQQPHVADVTEASRKLFFADQADQAGWAAFKEVIVRRTLDREAGITMIERPDGSVLRHAAVPLPDGAMLHTYLDVSDSARNERELRERAEALEKAVQKN